MSNNRITGRINLLNLQCVRQNMKGKLGPVDVLIIPIENNRLFIGEKGIYLDLVCFPITANTNPESKDTHLVKQSFDKETREKLGEEAMRAMPILGALREWTERTEADPVSSTTPIGPDDDLPF